MALGIPVTPQTLNYKIGQTVLALREALDQVQSVAAWLANHPNAGPDPLVTDFEMTDDEAYAVRVFFENVDALRVANASTIAMGRKMTGLE